MRRVLNLLVPTCYQDLSQEQLKYLYFLLAAGYSQAALQTYALFRFGRIDVTNDGNGMFTVRADDHEYGLTALQIAEALPSLDWMLTPPIIPVRVNTIQNHEAAHEVMCTDLTFDEYLALENFYQGWLLTQDHSCVVEMARILYSPDIRKLNAEEEIAVAYWYIGLKKLLARRFTHFFVSAPVSDTDKASPQVYGEKLRNAMNNQVRALTGGDITKNKQVLAMDVYAALTELDAKAADYEEWNKKKK